MLLEERTHELSAKESSTQEECLLLAPIFHLSIPKIYPGEL
jgi:hypothetical protein